MDAMLLPRQLVCLAQPTLLRHHWFFHLDLSSRLLRHIVFIANPSLLMSYYLVVLFIGLGQ